MSEQWKWRCLVCEKDLTPDSPHESGDDKTASLPNVEGGIITIHFGYGSRFDDMNGIIHRRLIDHQACICDNCYEKKMHLTRAVEKRSSSRFVTLSPGRSEELAQQIAGRTMTEAEQEEQRRSFAHGNVAIENPAATRALINEEAERMNRTGRS